jgi:hypothetical protein
MLAKKASDNWRGKMLQDLFYPQNNGELSDSITQNWTEQALECYKLQGNCKNCSISKGHYSFVCQMPKVVEVLKSVYGEPTV